MKEWKTVTGLSNKKNKMCLLSNLLKEQEKNGNFEIY